MSPTGEDPIARGTTEKQPKRRRINTRSEVARPVARKLASLALSWDEQDEALGVREREQLRRTLADAAEWLEWTALRNDRIDRAIKDMKTLAEAGARSIAKDLEDELAEKKSETTRLKKTAKSFHKLADSADFEAPIEVTYSRTARRADGLVTITETLMLADAEEAEKAARKIERKLGSWDNLRAQMLEDLKRRQEQLEATRNRIAAFAESYRGLVGEVFAILH